LRVYYSLDLLLKGHGDEADFLGFLQKLVPHRSLTLPFEPFRFWLRIRGDIHNRKTTPRLGESASRGLSDSVSQGVGDSPTWRVVESMTRRLGEPASECLIENSESRLTPPLGESKSRLLPDSASRGVAMESLFKFFKITAL
jgi:hypothetical protein